MCFIKSAGIVAAAALVSAPASARPADAPEAAFERYRSEINSHDFDRLARDVIARDALFVFTGEIHRGIDQVRTAFNRTWSALPDEVYSMSEPQWLARDRDTALVIFRYDYKGTTTDGKALQGGGRGTNLYRRTPAGWRLVYEHLSHDPKPASAQAPSPAALRSQRVQLLDEPIGRKDVARVQSARVTFAPGQVAGRHSHPVPALGYVTRGTIRFQLEGEPMRTLKEGDAFHEPAGRTVLHFDNASNDKDAAFVVTYLLGPGETETVHFGGARQ